jgi:hypothetical protein
VDGKIQTGLIEHNDKAEKDTEELVFRNSPHADNYLHFTGDNIEDISSRK